MLPYIATFLLIINTLAGDCLEIEMEAHQCSDAAAHIHVSGILMPGEINVVGNAGPLLVASAECRPMPDQIALGAPP